MKCSAWLGLPPRAWLSMLFAAAPLGACATTSGDEGTRSLEAELQSTGDLPLPSPVHLVPSRLGAQVALDRARLRVEAGGFKVPLPARLTAAGEASTRLALASLLPDPDRCGGTTEIIQLGARDQAPGSLVAFTCFTEVWTEPVKPGNGCGHREEAGCPLQGDEVLAGVAFDAVSTL